MVSQATIKEDDESRFQVSEKDLSRALDTDNQASNNELSDEDSTNDADNDQFSRTQLLTLTTIN